MTSETISARNKANAQKSTGPRSVEGKAAVAQNARRHGATSKPDPASVTAWLRIILDAPELAPDSFFGNDVRMRCAVSLAEAETQCSTAQHALDLFESGEAPPSESLRDMQHYFEWISEEMKEPDTTRRQFVTGLSILKRLKRQIDQETEPGKRQHRLLKRYLREARGRRRKAFQNWLACLARSSADERKAA